MKDIPPDGIYYDDALVIVAQMLNPNTWQILEERLSPTSPYYDAFPDRDTKEAAAREIERAYHNALRFADEWLLERIGRGILVAQTRNPVTGEILKLHRHASMGDFFTRTTDHMDEVRSMRPPIFFERENLDSAVKEIAPPTTGHVENPEQTRPAEPELLEKKAWLAWALKEYPKQRNELLTPYISRLHGLMEKADNVTAPWKYKTFRIRYYEAVKTDPQAVQKKRKSPRTV